MSTIPDISQVEQFDAKAYQRLIFRQIAAGKFHHSVLPRVKQIPLPILPQYIRALKKKSRASAINAFCCECMGWVNYSEEIKNCTDGGCPLYSHRPYKQGKNEQD